MTHDGRMARGKENKKLGLLDNADTQYFLNNKGGKTKVEQDIKKEEKVAENGLKEKPEASEPKDEVKDNDK